MVKLPKSAQRITKLEQAMHTLNSQRQPTKCILVGNYNINLMTSDCPAVTSYINTLRRNALFSEPCQQELQKTSKP